jgi:putative ABC transport system permease protein
MERRKLAAAFSMEGAFNDVVLKLSPGAREDEVIRRLDDMLDRYGGLGAIPRAQQMSHWYLTSEMEGLRKFGSTIPLVFLAVAAFLLNVVMTRLISVQREQIASLKAMGYSNLAIGWHYVQWALVVAAFGSLLGVAVGAWFGAEMTELYTTFFDFPILHYTLPLDVLVEAFGVGFAAAVLGSLIAVRRAVRLPPAEAMRPEPPVSYRKSLLERIGIGRFLSQPTRITLRSIERRPVRALVSIVGIASGAALLVGGTFSYDAMDQMVELHFFVAQRYDMMVSFYVPASPRAIHAAHALPGVVDAEGFRTVAVRYRNGHRTRTGSVTGLDPGVRLNRIMSMDGDQVVPPPEGLVLSRKLAEVLGARAGDLVTLEVLEGRRPTRQVPVVALVEEGLGTNAYMNRDALHALMGESRVLSGAYLAVDENARERLYGQLKNTPLVAGVMVQDAALEAFDETLSTMVGTVRTINILFAAVIAFGVVYNAARISLSERSRELATLRVIGFRRSEIAEILLGELAIVTALAIPLGLLFGKAMAALVVSAYDTELFRMPLIIHPRTYATAALTVIVAAFLSGWTVRRKLHKLDLISVLKTRE